MAWDWRTPELPLLEAGHCLCIASSCCIFLGLMRLNSSMNLGNTWVLRKRQALQSMRVTSRGLSSLVPFLDMSRLRRTLPLS